jgi:hypothetical protein
MKTIKASNIIITIGLLLLCLDISAQPPTGKKAISDELMKNPYIFEGEIISSQHYYTIKTGEYSYENYNSYLVQVTKVIRGNIQKGTINLLQSVPGVIYRDSNMTRLAGQPSDGGVPNVPKEALYFCYRELPTIDSSYKTTNTMAVECYAAESMSNGELKNDNYDNLILYFSSKAEFYDYISANYGITIGNK